MLKLKTVKSKYELFGKHPGYLDEGRNGSGVRLEMLSYNAAGAERLNGITLENALSLQAEDRISWLIYHGVPAVEQLKFIGEKFKLDVLWLEDIQNCSMVRPGFSVSGDCFFAVLKFPFMIGGAEFKMAPLCFVASGKTLITFLASEDSSFEPLLERVEKSRGRICSKGIDYLAFCHLDLAVDYYFMFINQLSGELEEMEEKVVSSPGPELLKELQRLKHIAALIRKSVWPLREMIHSMRGDDSSFIGEETEKYYQVLDSHMLLISDNAESVREMISGLLEIYLSSISNRMNEVMKVLTLIATIFIPLTFIAGIYGMNFTNMPELKWRYGYFLALGIMTVTAFAMVTFFHRKKWL
ncbi:MAG: magnesium/cobalt transporter CorA [Victivallaceae bacterium]|nr:magnesium/cobalt transporter CorA [Victivallaceae bacterium]